MKGVRPHPTKHTRYHGETWWQIDLGRDKAGKRVYLSYKGSYEAACGFRANALPKQRSESANTSIDPKVHELIIPFLAWYKNEASPRTIRDIRYSVDLYFIPWFGRLYPEQLTFELFNEFKQALLNKGLSPVTVNKHLNYFSTIIKWACDTGRIKESPVIPRFSKKKTQPREQIHPLTKRQVRGILTHIEPEYKLLFLLMVDCGLRQEEAMYLKVDDIDEDAETIRVMGKGSKIRIVAFMSDRFEDELAPYLDAKTEGYLVVNPKTGKPYRTIWKPLKRAAEKAGITKKVNHHILRHTFATNCAKAGYSPYVTQKLLGHSSIDTTMKIYTHLGLDFVGDEVRKMRGKI